MLTGAHWTSNTLTSSTPSDRIAGFALELAQDFTGFYEQCKVIGAEPEGVESFRIALSRAAQRVIATALGLLGVSAPESM